MGSSDKVDVMIVDDRINGLVTLEAVLKLPGVNLVRAQSGQEALAQLSTHEFAVILLDVQMPEMDGFQAARLIRQHPNHKSTPIIFVTAINKDDKYIFEGYEAGAVDYIFKPFEAQVVRSKVTVFVDLFRKSKLLEEQNEIIRESERKERTLKLAEAELEGLRRYATLADSIPHIVWKAKLDGAFNYFNRLWTEYTGLTHDDSVGDGWQKAVESEDLKKFLAAWQEAQKNQKPFEAECRLRRGDGKMLWHWVRAVPETGVDGKTVGWIGTGTNINEKKVAETRLVEAERRAVAASDAKSTFLANMSHEIRTPLSSILGFTELILNPSISIEERNKGLSAVRRGGRQLLKIIDEILDLSKVEAGHLRIEMAAVHLPSFLSEIQSMLSPQADAKNINLKFHVESMIPEVIRTDPVRLRQILMNMIGNAVKFTSSGEVSVEISWAKNESKVVNGKKSSNRMRFLIRDSGIGISPSLTEKLFHPFVQADSSATRIFGGTGLGLALSRRLAQALGGNVNLLSSRPGHGSVFAVDIEADAVSENYFNVFEPIVDATPKAPEPNDQKMLDGVNILLVEDSPDNQLLISKFLRMAGAEVELANNGEEGVRKALAGQHKVVLMDIQMPQMDGYRATSHLRTKGYTRPIIALTAHALKDEKERCLAVGYTDHLTKPVDRRALISLVAKASGLNAGTGS